MSLKREFVFKLTKGYRGRTKNNYTLARRQVARSLNYQYISRKLRKRDVRSAWIQQINAGARQHGVSYGQFIHGLSMSSIALDRKSLAELAVHEPISFASLCEGVKSVLGSSWRDVNRNRLNLAYYDQFQPEEPQTIQNLVTAPTTTSTPQPDVLPTQSRYPKKYIPKSGTPRPTTPQKGFEEAVKVVFAKGTAKAEMTNKEYLKTGKSAKKETPVKYIKSRRIRNLAISQGKHVSMPKKKTKAPPLSKVPPVTQKPVKNKKHSE
eukprot:TRINITY_DN13772_c0_g1_i1.p1 TRINITY_DN13772_c0_g1~~TRINITY_DN13772_c0_g1_i1.p1  ORF type:complete len:292 (-),score=65.00 TRINITY_DN13772_c0_g1_i1:118-912(-)